MNSDAARFRGRSVMGKAVRILTLLLLMSMCRSASGQQLNLRLLEAAKAGDKAQVQTLLAKGADPNTRGKDGSTPLIWMASLGLTDGVDALLEKGAYVNAKDKTGWTALMGAARKGHSDTVRALLEKGAYVDAQDNNGWTALMSASASPHPETVRALLEKGADVNAKDKTGWTALMGAAGSGQLESVRALLTKGADRNARNRDGRTALTVASDRNYSEVIALLENPPGQNEASASKRPTAAAPGASPIATTPKDGAAAHPRPGTAVGAIPVPHPGGAGSVPTAQPPAAVPESRSSLSSQLLAAAQEGDTSDVESLLGKGADINSRGPYGNTPLMAAALAGHTDTLRLLLGKGADVNARGNTGRTALMEAALEGYADAVKVLLDSGADVNAKDEGGWTALFWAAFAQRRAVVPILLEKGADANSKNKYDDTPLIRAAYAGDTEMVRTLLEFKAEVNASDNLGRTALMEAARQGHTDAVRVLVETGADFKAKDRDGETALSLAEKQKHPEVIALLKNPPVPQENNSLGKRAAPGTEAPKQGDSPDSGGTPDVAAGGDSRARAQAYFRIGLNMQMVEMGLAQSNDVAVGWAQNIQQDLAKVGAPRDLIQLASATQNRLKVSPKQAYGSSGDLIRVLRERLDQFCSSRPEEKFFYHAAGFAVRLNLIGENMQRAEKSTPSTDGSRLEILPLATAMTGQCLDTVGCKELALIYFSDAAAILKKPQLTSEEGTALSRDANEIEKALSGKEL
jgi:ankyrin repeat protein